MLKLSRQMFQWPEPILGRISCTR